MTTIDPTAAFNDIAARYTAARADLRAAKKAHGKKSTETKAARKVVRAIKKERAEFAAANPGFKAPPKAKKAAPGMQRREPVAQPDRTAGETVGIFRGGKWYAPDGVTEVPGPGVDEAKNPWTEAGVDVAAVRDAGNAMAVAAEVANAAVAKVSVTALLLKALAEGNSGSPSQLAAWVTSGGNAVTAKQAGDALARLAKTGKVVKADGKYAAAAK